MTENTEEQKSPKRRRTLVVIVAFLLTLLLAVRFVVLRSALNSDWLITQIRQATGLPIEFGQIRAGGLTGMVLTFDSIDLPSSTETGLPGVSIENLRLDVGWLSLVSHDVRIHKAHASRVVIELGVDEAGTLNLERLGSVLMDRSVQSADTLILRSLGLPATTSDILITRSAAPNLRFSLLNVHVDDLDVTLHAPRGKSQSFNDMQLSMQMAGDGQPLRMDLQSAKDGAGINIRGSLGLTFDGDQVIPGKGNVEVKAVGLDSRTIGAAFGLEMPDDLGNTTLHITARLDAGAEAEFSISDGEYRATGKIESNALAPPLKVTGNCNVLAPELPSTLILDLAATCAESLQDISVDSFSSSMKGAPASILITGNVKGLPDSPVMSGEVALDVDAAWFESIRQFGQVLLPDLKLESVLTRGLSFNATPHAIDLRGNISLLGLMEFDTSFRVIPAEHAVEIAYAKGTSVAKAAVNAKGRLEFSNGLTGRLELSSRTPLFLVTPLLPVVGISLPLGTSASGTLQVQQEIVIGHEASSVKGTVALDNAGLKIAYLVPVTVGDFALKNHISWQPAQALYTLHDLSVSSTSPTVPLHFSTRGELREGNVDLTADGTLFLERIHRQFGGWIRLLIPAISTSGEAGVQCRIQGRLLSPILEGKVDLTPAGFEFGSLINKQPGDPLACNLSGTVRNNVTEFIFENQKDDEFKRLYISTVPGDGGRRTDYAVSMRSGAATRSLPFAKEITVEAPYAIESQFQFAEFPLTPSQVWPKLVGKISARTEAGKLNGLRSFAPLESLLARLSAVSGKEFGTLDVANSRLDFNKTADAVLIHEINIDTIGFVDIKGKGTVDLKAETVNVVASLSPDSEWIDALPLDLRPAKWDDWKVVVSGKWSSPSLEFKGMPDRLTKALSATPKDSPAPTLPPE